MHKYVHAYVCTYILSNGNYKSLIYQFHLFIEENTRQYFKHNDEIYLTLLLKAKMLENKKYKTMWLTLICLYCTCQTMINLCGNKMPTRCKRWYLLQILLHAQHVSGNTMPTVRSSRVLYRWSLPVVFGALVFRLSVWCGAGGYVSGLQAAACNKICNKYHLLHLVGILFPHNNDDARSKSLQIELPTITSTRQIVKHHSDTMRVSSSMFWFCVLQTCNTYEGEERCIQISGGETWRK